MRYVMKNNHVSVGVDLKTYKKIKHICEAEDRNIRQQIARLVNEYYNKEYANKNNTGGIGSLS